MSEVASGSDAGPVVEVEFRVQSDSYPFVGVSADLACTLKLAKMLPRPGDRYAEFFDVAGADPDRIVSLASEHGTLDAALVSEYERGGLFEFTVAGDCPAYELAELGALPRTVEGVDGTGRIVADVPAEYDASALVTAFLDEYDDAELACKREKESVEPVFGDPAFRELVETDLTDRQREVIEAAYAAGYYDWPRERTGSEVATELGISSATFSEHIHTAERKLLAALFDRGPGGA